MNKNTNQTFEVSFRKEDDGSTSILCYQDGQLLHTEPIDMNMCCEYFDSYVHFVGKIIRGLDKYCSRIFRTIVITRGNYHYSFKHDKELQPHTSVDLEELEIPHTLWKFPDRDELIETIDNIDA